MSYRVIKLFVILLFWLILMVLAAELGLFASKDAGYVLVSVNNYSLETTFWGGLIVWAVTLVLTAVLVKLAGWLRIGRILSDWNHSRLSNRAARMLNDGLKSLSQGQFRAAYKMLDSSAKRSRSPSLNYLLAAFAAHSEGKTELCDTYLTKAENAENSDPVMLGMIQALVQTQRDEFEQALATLSRIQGQDKNPFRLELLGKVYQQLHDWDNLEKVIHTLDKMGHKPINRSLRTGADGMLAERLKSAPGNEVDQIWQALPKARRSTPEVVEAYAGRMAAAGRLSDAETLLRKTISKDFNSSLILSYGLIQADSKQQISAVKEWMQSAPQMPELLLTLGRLYMKAGQLAEATEVLVQATTIQNCPKEAHAELARLLVSQGQLQQSQKHLDTYLSGLTGMSQVSLPQPVSGS